MAFPSGILVVAGKDDYLVEKLIELGYVTNDQVEPLRAEAEEAGRGLLELMLERQLIDPATVTLAKAAHFGVEIINLAGMKLEDDVISSVPRHIAKRYRVVPVFHHDNSIVLAMSDPSDLDTIDSLQHLLKSDLEIRVASEEEIEEALKQYYGAADDEVGRMIQDITEGEVEIGALPSNLGVDDGATVDADAPIIKLVNGMIVDAFKMRASDIHLEPLSKTFRMRYRIDGVLHEMKAPPEASADSPSSAGSRSSPTCRLRKSASRRTAASRPPWAAS